MVYLVFSFKFRCLVKGGLCKHFLNVVGVAFLLRRDVDPDNDDLAVLILFILIYCSHCRLNSPVFSNFK